MMTKEKQGACSVYKTIYDEEIDALYVIFSNEKAGFAREIDDNRIVDYSANPGKPIAVSLHNISDGVKIEGLPKPDVLCKVLDGLDINIH